MSRKNPKASVCIPVYNGADYIAASIQSVLDQTFEDFELIVSDNCSTDDTAAVVAGFTDRRLTYARNSQNLGIAGNANRCLELARGEYVCIWHHDDMMFPTNLELKVRFLEEHPSAGMVYSALLLIDAAGESIGTRWTKEPERLRDCIQPGLQLFRRYVDHMVIGGMIFIGSVLTRRQCYGRLGHFHTSLPQCHDSEMWMRIALYYDVGYLVTPLLKWRLHKDSATHTSPALRGARWLAQHYDAVKCVLDQHGDRVPDCHVLRRETPVRFAAAAIERGLDTFYGHDLGLAADYLRFAAKLRPAVMLDAQFWKLAARIAATPTGGRLYRALRHRLRRSD